MSDGFTDLAASFNESAAACLRDGMRIPFVIEKYNILLKHEAKTPEDRVWLVSTLLDTGISWLNKLASPEFKANIAGVAITLVEPIFTTLASKETLASVPDNAAQKLASAAFALATRGENLKYGDLPRSGGDEDKVFVAYREELLGLARMARQAADTFAAAQESIGDVTTGKPVPVSKAYTLKQPGGQSA